MRKNRDVPWGEWNSRDKTVSGIAGISALVCLLMGSINIAINLIESGIPTFAQNPLVAWLFAFLAPAGAMSVKSVYNALDSDRARKRYTYIIYSLAITALLAWTILFSVNFHGVSAGIDWDALGEDGSTGSGGLFVFSQIVAEVLIGAALILVVDNCFSRYSALSYIENPEWLELKRRLDEHAAVHAVLHTERAKVRGALAQLLAARQKFIDDSGAEFWSQ